MINALLLAISEEPLRSNLRGDLPLVILGSIIAAIGVAAVVVQLSRWQSGERVLLWFGLFAGPYGLRLLTNTTPFQMAFGELQGVWPFVSKLVEFATLVPALLLFEDFYGKGWRSSVRWLIWAYVVFATIAFTSIVIQRRARTWSRQLASELFSSCPAILLLGRLMRYKPPQVLSACQSNNRVLAMRSCANVRKRATNPKDKTPWSCVGRRDASGYANSELNPAAHKPRDGECVAVSSATRFRSTPLSKILFMASGVVATLSSRITSPASLRTQ